MPTWVAEIDALDGAGFAKTLRFADGALAKQQYYYEPRMKSAAVVYVSPSDGGTFKIFSTPNIGEIEVVNNDGGLNYLADYAVDGRTCKMAIIDDDLVTRTDYFTGTVDRMSERGNSVYFRLRSMTDLMGNTHPLNKYLGNNALPEGVEGVTADIKGNVKPKVFGNVYQAPAVLVNTSKSIYQVSDRSTCVIDAVYEAGAPITQGADYTDLTDMLTNAPAAGYWRRYQGYFRTGTTMVRTVTADAHDGTGLAGSVMANIFAERGIVMDADSMAALNAVGTCGVFANSEVSTTQMLDTIAKSVGGYWYFIGNVAYANLIQLATTSSLTLRDFSITSIERKATGMGSNGVPITNITMQCDKIETTQTDVAGVVTQSNKSRLSQQYRTAEANDSSVLARHPLAEKLKIEGGVLNNLLDGLSVATRLLNIAKNRVDIVSVSASFNIIPEIPALGGGVTIYSTRLGYNTGKLFTLIGYSLDIRRKTITMDLMG